MPIYSIPNAIQASIAPTYRTLAAVWVGAGAKRFRVYSLNLGTIANPPGGLDQALLGGNPGSMITIDVSRFVAPGGLVGTAAIPLPLTPTDGAASSVASVNLTTEPSVVGVRLANFGIGDRASPDFTFPAQGTGWICAGAGNGLLIRAKSGSWVAPLDCRVWIEE